MENSILNDIKQLLGLAADYTPFDSNLIIQINSALFKLVQFGVGEPDFTISSSTDKWSDFLDEDDNFFPIKTFVYLQVKLLFDPPQSGTQIDMINKQIEEITFRLNVKVESKLDE